MDDVTAVETVAGEIVRGDSRRGEFASEGSCGGRGAPEVVLVHRVENLIEALIIRTDLDDNELETTLYVRRGCLDEGSEVAVVVKLPMAFHRTASRFRIRYRGNTISSSMASLRVATLPFRSKKCQGHNV